MHTKTAANSALLAKDKAMISSMDSNRMTWRCGICHRVKKSMIPSTAVRHISTATHKMLSWQSSIVDASSMGHTHHIAKAKEEVEALKGQSSTKTTTGSGSTPDRPSKNLKVDPQTQVVEDKAFSRLAFKAPIQAYQPTSQPWWNTKGEESTEDEEEDPYYNGDSSGSEG
ncbi:BQ2448_1497 [Microbotryum intermedium]|uniref:BQ2448_1497 protein n=1 Tax=Microbotryum intermedium TaxID=269621 RepID=A0A238FDK9_9BASI|nr:BQ2448_1497 [Microbotryum intermedium]